MQSGGGGPLPGSTASLPRTCARGQADVALGVKPGGLPAPRRAPSVHLGPGRFQQGPALPCLWAAQWKAHGEVGAQGLRGLGPDEGHGGLPAGPSWGGRGGLRSTPTRRAPLPVMPTPAARHDKTQNVKQIFRASLPSTAPASCPGRPRATSCLLRRTRDATVSRPALAAVTRGLDTSHTRHRTHWVT